MPSTSASRSIFDTWLLHPVFWRTAFAAYLLLIAWLSLANLNVTESFDHSDKVKHLAAYAVFAVIGGLAFSKKPLLYYCMIFITAYGAAMELVQGMSAHREGSWLDMLANVSGVALGWAVIAFILTKINDEVAAPLPTFKEGNK